MSLFRALLTIGGAIIICGIAGAFIGFALARYIPGYYRGVSRNGENPDFDPVQVGVGLGASQGLICGVIVGSVAVLSVAWYNSRRSRVLADEEKFFRDE